MNCRALNSNPGLCCMEGAALGALPRSMFVLSAIAIVAAHAPVACTTRSWTGGWTRGWTGMRGTAIAGMPPIDANGASAERGGVFAHIALQAGV